MRAARSASQVRAVRRSVVVCLFFSFGGIDCGRRCAISERRRRNENVGISSPEWSVSRLHLPPVAGCRKRIAAPFDRINRTASAGDPTNRSNHRQNAISSDSLYFDGALSSLFTIASPGLAVCAPQTGSHERRRRRQIGAQSRPHMRPIRAGVAFVCCDLELVMSGAKYEAKAAARTHENPAAATGRQSVNTQNTMIDKRKKKKNATARRTKSAARGATSGGEQSAEETIAAEKYSLAHSCT